MMQKKRNFAFTLAATVFVLITSLYGATGTGWRTDGSGAYPQATTVLRWAATTNIIWSTPLPKWSNASPLPVKKRVFVCGEEAILYCINATDGRILWTRTNDYTTVSDQAPASKPPKHGIAGYTSPTPVTDGKHVYFLGGLGTAACYDMQGKRKWIQIVGQPKHGWGHSASPVLVDNKLIVHIANTVYGLNAQSGEEVWKATSPGSWGTPALGYIGKVPVVLTTGGILMNATDGTVLTKKIVGLPWSSAVIQDGIIYVADNGIATALKLPQTITEPLNIEKLWTVKIKADRYYASPIIHKGLLYAVSRAGHFSVVDVTKGELVYDKKLSFAGGTHYSSPTLAGNTLLLTSDKGKTLMLQPGREYRELAINSLDPVRSTPIIDGNRIYFRTLKKLYCIGATKPNPNSD